MMRYIISTTCISFLSALASICCFGQVVINPLSNKQTDHTPPLIMIHVYDADVLTATADELNQSVVVFDENTITPPMHPYGLDSVKVQISSPKMSVVCANHYGMNMVSTNKAFRSKELTITASKKGYKTLKQTIKATSLQLILDLYLTKDDD